MAERTIDGQVELLFIIGVGTIIEDTVESLRGLWRTWVGRVERRCDTILQI